MSLTESPPLAGAALANHENHGPWTDERVEKLKRLWLAEELTAYQIACAIGGLEDCADHGKNAVIGKARRLGLKAHRKSPGKTPYIRPEKPKTRHIATHLQKRKAEAKERPSEQALPEAEPLIFSATPCSLLELTDDTCRWPNGDPREPDFHFCGGMAIEGASYCGAHMRIAYHVPPARRAPART